MRQHRPTLDDIEPVEEEGVSVSTRQVHSLTLFHEMYHVTLGTKATSDEECKSRQEGISPSSPLISLVWAWVV